MRVGIFWRTREWGSVWLRSRRDNQIKMRCTRELCLTLNDSGYAQGKGLDIEQTDRPKILFQ